ncbi:MAG: SagB/ThcOx family dehydrogenase [Myxococcota bacterium]|nr:SagB/ThcOx family dehydrogenase [Myxococcota bacterium]
MIRSKAFALLVSLTLGPFGLDSQARAAGDSPISLPETRADGDVSVERALAQRRSQRRFASEPLSLGDAAQLLWAAQGITHPDGLRTAPSAGALYPLELHLVVDDVAGLAPGAYRYEPRHHRLVPRLKGDALAAIVAATRGQDWVGQAPAIIVITGIPERSRRKYGKRAARYVHMEVGHAAQNVYLQATALGLATTMVGAFRDDALTRALELPRGEQPLGLLPIGRPR